MAELRKISCEPAGGDIVPLLESIIDRAQRGELSAVAVALVNRDGCTGQEWSQLPSIGTMIGSVAVLQHRLVERILE